MTLSLVYTFSGRGLKYAEVENGMSKVGMGMLLVRRQGLDTEFGMT